MFLVMKNCIWNDILILQNLVLAGNVRFTRMHLVNDGYFVKYRCRS